MHPYSARSGLTQVALCYLVGGLLAGTAGAQVQPVPKGYLTDTGGAVVLNGARDCWRTWSGGDRSATNACAPVQASLLGVEAIPVAPPGDPLPVPPLPVPPTMADELKPVTRLTLDTDALFDFDTAELRPRGRERLTAFAVQVRSLEADRITAAGHTDRIGSARYNQRLSEARASAVRRFLIAQGIAPERVSTVGHGKSRPVTRAGACDGVKSAAVLACLQPDRRVEIEAVRAGTAL
jgi:OOP family OmpA-OmpF porin